jgi:hypothetical protein
MKYARNIFTYPITNDNKAIGLLKKYRAEANAAKNYTQNPYDLGNNQNSNM